MSKQRPYGTFEEAYMIQMLTRIPEVLDDFIFSIIELNNLFNIVPGFRSLYLPFRFYDEPLICEYWNGLCRMYGNVTVFERSNYILVENLDLCTEHLIDLVIDSFPPGWDIIQDEQILSLHDVQFI